MTNHQTVQAVNKERKRFPNFKHQSEKMQNKVIENTNPTSENAIPRYCLFYWFCGGSFKLNDENDRSRGLT